MACFLFGPRRGINPEEVGLGTAKKLFIVSVLLLVSLCTGMRLALADPETSIVWSHCGNYSGKYEYRNGSAFQLNLNSVLESLVRHVNPSGFNTSNVVVEGKTSDSPVYGLVQCRGDLDSSDCEQCASTAKENLVRGCQNTSGFIQLDGCFLRYDNHSFYGDLDSLLVHLICNGGNSSRPQQFTNTVKALVSNIINKAPESPKLLAAVTVPEPSSLTGNVYSLAQCWRDLSRTSCGSCLTMAFEKLFSCHSGAVGAQFGSQNCYLRYEVYRFFDTSVLSPPPAESPLVSSERKNTRVLGIALGVVAGGTLGLITAIMMFKRNCFSWLKRPEQNSGSIDPEIAAKYSGVLPYGREVAVKRLYIGSRQGDAEFLNEANLISRVQHRNLVKLLGCSIENSERLLVYEYLPNSSLDKILFDPPEHNLLDWKARYEIIIGTARGLAYLHEESEIRIIHRDIKTSNILLDGKYRPKIADFGLARFFAEDHSHVSANVAGTLGYMAPEYALHGQLTEKVDVFGFGVLLLEIISGRKSQSLVHDTGFLIKETWRLFKAERTLEIIDPALKGSYSLDEGIRVINIGLLCTQAAAPLRPSMSRVVTMLTNEPENLPTPTKPGYIDLDSVMVVHDHVKRPAINVTPPQEPDKTSSSAATSSTRPSDIQSGAAYSSSSILEPR